MAPKRWISTAVLTASIAALPSDPALAQTTVPSTAPAAGDAPVQPQALVDRDLAELYSQLTRATQIATHRDETANEARREEAARRLLSRPSPRAAEYILEALKGPARLAVVRAIADVPQPAERFIAPLLPLLGTDRVLTDAAARALSHYPDNPVVRERLISFAQNANQPASMRIGVVRSLGAFTTRDAADALVALVSDAKQPAAVQNAAADALIDMTGLTVNRNDAQRWKQWQSANASRTDVDWRAEILGGRDRRRSDAERAQTDFVNELKQILAEQYQQADRTTKFAMEMRFLNSPEPRVRAMGVQQVLEDKITATPYSPLAPRRLQELIGDSDANVRLIAAQAIKNDSDALDAILTQLPQETSEEVKFAQVTALIPMKRLRAVPVLRQSLRDPSLRVATAAVEALRGIFSSVMAQDPASAKALAAEFWQVGTLRAAEPGGVEFRAAAIEAIGALQDRLRAPDLLRLLDINTPERIRSAALHALGDLGDRNTYFQIAQWLQNEPLPAVRIDAINALGNTSTFELAADTLYHYMSPNTEPDKAVRERAWVQFQSLLPKAISLEALNRWASEFQNDPTRRLQVLLVLNRKLQNEMRWEDLAASRQNTGETYLKLGDPARAAIQFSEALDYWQKKAVANQVTVQLIDQLLKALLAAKQYKEAADFGARQIELSRAMQDRIAPTLRNAAEELFTAGARDNDVQKLTDAMSLIDNVLKMQPSLDERYQADLRSFQRDGQQKLKSLGK